MKHTRIVPVIALSFLFVPLLLSAQGVGLNLGPAIVSDYPAAESPGFTIGLDYYYSVDDDGMISTALQYSSFPVSDEAINGSNLEFSSLKSIALLTSIRFRIAADLDEIAPIVTLGAGPAYRFGGSNDDLDVDMVGDIPISVEGWLGAGVDWPISEESLALVGQIRYPLSLQFVETPGDFETELVRPGFFLTIGIEYRSE